MTEYIKSMQKYIGHELQFDMPQQASIQNIIKWASSTPQYRNAQMQNIKFLVSYLCFASVS